MTTSSSSQKKKTVISDLIPNNYEEQPELIEGKTRVFKDKVAARVDDLDNLGKFVTLFQVFMAITMKRYVLLDEFGTAKARERINKKILGMLSRV